MNKFIIDQPSLDSYFRGIVLFGKNAATYKFALAKSLIELTSNGTDFISLKDLAIPFIRYTNEHVLNGNKQITSNSSKYFDAFDKYNSKECDIDDIVKLTLNAPFKNVIDRFHTVNDSDLDTKFYEIATRNKVKGIVLTDNLYKISENSSLNNLFIETEARWNLVENAWSLSINPALLNVSYDNDDNSLFITDNTLGKRVDITSCRDALNGYQRGKCFYCGAPISVNPHSENLCDVYHFIPHTLQQSVNDDLNINGVWNLVLSCKKCNRGENGKFAKLAIPDPYLQNLYDRNEYFIGSHHPLRETLINQTGMNAKSRLKYLNDRYNLALSMLLVPWKPSIVFE
ncbi:HNH endonuclease family protein [[Clostridium] bifermentans ATCC 19299]|uniref:HNH endonuclease domain-containing protein n=1 Tax=Paraclostridium bifermentans TaxID=1490 RepID=UPI00038D8B00|nr:HNH endonuclease domain-containing protein [Paraclostridium bifermentans]EQK46752.1 HNH endonuclease family protein [[Clostridium] bifermentans ATCC 19299] [Paraclostridium bifermentans ATCC 19299]